MSEDFVNNLQTRYPLLYNYFLIHTPEMWDTQKVLSKLQEWTPDDFNKLERFLSEETV